MKIIQVLPELTVGGPSYTVVELSRALSRMGNEVQFHTANTNLDSLNGLEVISYKPIRWPIINQLGFSFSQYGKLKKECQNAQIIQTNSLWMYPNFVTEFARRGTKAKSVIMPRGTLSEYALSISAWKKKIVLLLGQKTALKKADMFIATCTMEYQDIRNFGLEAPVAIIPNGIHIPKISSDVKKEKRVVFLSRIHKKKGVDILIDAWSRVEKDSRFADWSLSIVGPMTAYAKEMQKYAMDKQCKRIQFTGEMSGQMKFDYLAGSSLFVLPTHSENFGIAVAEALSCSVPAICTTGAPWEGLETNHCGRWIQLSVDVLAESLMELMILPLEELAQMGNNGLEWMQREFSWDMIAYKTNLAFQWLQTPSAIEVPDFIKID